MSSPHVLSPPCINCRSAEPPDPEKETLHALNILSRLRILQGRTDNELATSEPQTASKSPIRAKAKATVYQTSETVLKTPNKDDSGNTSYPLNDASLHLNPTEATKSPKGRTKSAVPPILPKSGSKESLGDVLEKPKTRTPRMVSPRNVKELISEKVSFDSGNVNAGSHGKSSSAPSTVEVPPRHSKTTETSKVTKILSPRGKPEVSPERDSHATQEQPKSHSTGVTTTTTIPTSTSSPTISRRNYTRTETKKLIVPARRKTANEMGKYSIVGKGSRLTWGARMFVFFST